MKHITVATYNICHGHYAAYDWTRIASVIREASADMVGFQEIDMFTNRTGGVDTITELISATGLPHALFIPAMSYDGGQYGTAILSRYPIAESGTCPLPSAHYEPRAFGWVTVTTDGGNPFTLLNTHFACESHDQQTIQFETLAEWMGTQLHCSTPTVLTGDFNTEDFASFFPVQQLGYSLVNDSFHKYNTFRTNPAAIDNIVYRDGLLTPMEYGMIQSDASDHNLLWCRFVME
ncbi:MAG: endonuclease/exonuclease/phosphatase family protein [Clostridia bacterium]|nr:endonuclease/exonuclease/phosphatase family protein [Clostridia bacterium]